MIICEVNIHDEQTCNEVHTIMICDSSKVNETDAQVVVDKATEISKNIKDPTKAIEYLRSHGFKAAKHMMEVTVGTNL
jgi:hypothetical protein